jgi:hypothetical protein
MSKQTVELLEAFEALPEEERRIFTAEYCRRASGRWDEEETTNPLDRLLARLDAEKDGATSRATLIN